jgi:peptidoglycan hydrolase-like protein with peptidoglycan-binding domain
MKWYSIAALLALALVGFVVAQDNTAPQGTNPTGKTGGTVVQPTPKAVPVTPALVRSAQQELDRRGYSPGPADGVLGPKTRAALRKFQADEKLPPTGRLDENTMAKLNVGGANTIGAAPADLGRGGKAAGHDVKEGQPVEGAKAIGKGTASFGKKVGKGTASVTKKGVEKVGQGVSAVGKKIEGKPEGEKPKPSDNPPPQH